MTATLSPAASATPVSGQPIIDLFAELESAPGHFRVILSEECTAAAYIATDSNEKRAIYRDAKDCLLRLSCRTFGVALLAKAFMIAVAPKAKDDRKLVLSQMLAVSKEGLELALDHLILDAQEKALEVYVATDPTDNEAIEEVLNSARQSVKALRTLQSWINNFDANMGAVKRAVDVVKARGTGIDDLDGVTLTPGEWAYRMMSNKAIGVQAIRTADKAYSKSLKAARKVQK